VVLQEEKVLPLVDGFAQTFCCTLYTSSIWKFADFFSLSGMQLYIQFFFSVSSGEEIHQVTLGWKLRGPRNVHVISLFEAFSCDRLGHVQWRQYQAVASSSPRRLVVLKLLCSQIFTQRKQ
jgi:hypothetical protein